MHKVCQNQTIFVLHPPRYIGIARCHESHLRSDRIMELMRNSYAIPFGVGLDIFIIYNRSSLGLNV